MYLITLTFSFFFFFEKKYKKKTFYEEENNGRRSKAFHFYFIFFHFSKPYGLKQREKIKYKIDKREEKKKGKEERKVKRKVGWNTRSVRCNMIVSMLSAFARNNLNCIRSFRKKERKKKYCFTHNPLPFHPFAIGNILHSLYCVWNVCHIYGFIFSNSPVRGFFILFSELCIESRSGKFTHCVSIYFIFLSIRINYYCWQPQKRKEKKETRKQLSFIF